MQTTNFGRRANGPQVYRTPSTKARDIALSIFCFMAKGVPRTMKDYGIEHNETMCQLVQDALAEIVTKRQAA